jgi:hypothetical protein
LDFLVKLAVVVLAPLALVQVAVVLAASALGHKQAILVAARRRVLLGCDNVGTQNALLARHNSHKAHQ